MTSFIFSQFISLCICVPSITVATLKILQLHTNFYLEEHREKEVSLESYYLIAVWYYHFLFFVKVWLCLYESLPCHYLFYLFVCYNLLKNMLNIEMVIYKKEVHLLHLSLQKSLNRKLFPSQLVKSKSMGKSCTL